MAAFFQVENLFWVAFVAAAAALIYAGVQLYRIWKDLSTSFPGSWARAF